MAAGLSDYVITTYAEIEMRRRVYLLRVVVDVDRRPAEVVTAYRTSRVSKYWRANG
jgi:hypothetical protein